MPKSDDYHYLSLALMSSELIAWHDRLRARRLRAHHSTNIYLQSSEKWTECLPLLSSSRS